MIKISVITVVYNDFSHIQETIESVINQDYTDLEYIIIDGNSTDGTIDIIKKFHDRINFFLTEEDKGIYDAMNKGIMNASGDWLLFLNSGDVFINSTLITKCKNYLEYADYDIVYGDVKAKSKELGISYNIKSNKIELIKNIMPMNHQSCFIKRDWHTLNLYNIKYKIAADYHFFLISYLSKRKFLKVNQVIAIISTGGLSDANRVKTFKEFLNIKNELNYSFYNYIYFIKQITYYYFTRIAHILLPSKMVSFLLMQKSKILNQ